MTIWTLETLQELATKQNKACRAIQRICNTDKFIEFVGRCDSASKTYIAFLIASQSVDDLYKFLQATTLEEMTYRQLRDIAQRYRVKYYSRLTKEELLHEINKVKR